MTSLDKKSLRAAHFSIHVGVSPEAPAGESGELEAEALHLAETLTRLAPVVLDRMAARMAERYKQLVELMLGDVSPTPLDVDAACMAARALHAVFEGTEWVTAAQAASLAGLGLGNPSGTVNRWKKQGKIFALQRNGQDYYPRYLFSDDFRPLDAAEQVIGILAADGRFGPDRLASWFESPTGLLDDGRPRERLATSPDKVILAARRTFDAELYAA